MTTASLLRLTALPPFQALSSQRHELPSSAFLTPLRLQMPLLSVKRCYVHHTPISMSYRVTIPASERLLSALSYSLPFLNSLHYGRFFFAHFPAMGLVLEPLLPLIGAYRSFPYASFVAFFALYLRVVRNPAFGRYVRFNAMQAVVLDVLLALPALLQRVFGVPVRGFAFRLLQISYDVIFVLSLGCFLYAFVSCVLGKTPYLPLVASAADRQI